MDNRAGYSFSLQDIVALTVKSILCMITALSAHGELNFSLHPFFPPNAERGESFREIRCRKGLRQFHVGDPPGITLFFNELLLYPCVCYIWNNIPC